MICITLLFSPFFSLIYFFSSSLFFNFPLFPCSPFSPLIPLFHSRFLSLYSSPPPHLPLLSSTLFSPPFPSSPLLSSPYQSLFSYETDRSPFHHPALLTKQYSSSLFFPSFQPRIIVCFCLTCLSCLVCLLIGTIQQDS